MSFEAVAGWFAVARALVFPGELPLISTVGTIIAFEVLGVAVWMTGSHFGIPAVVPKAQAAILAFAGVVAAVLIWGTLGSHGIALDAPVDLGSTILRGLLLLAIVVWSVYCAMLSRRVVPLVPILTPWPMRLSGPVRWSTQRVRVSGFVIATITETRFQFSRVAEQALWLPSRVRLLSTSQANRPKWVNGAGIRRVSQG